MKDFHGIIFAYSAAPEMRELISGRTAASMPFCGRYRLIDFSLSSLMNAGVLNVGVIMKRDYQSLLDHVGSGKTWDMSRHSGGLRILPPFGLPEYHTGNYTGTIEALNAVRTYIKAIPQKYIILMLGNLAANIDLDAAMHQHVNTGVGITAICGDETPSGTHHRYIPDEDSMVSSALFNRETDGPGLPSLECYIVNRELLLTMMDRCRAGDQLRFHKDAVARYLQEGGRMGIYVHHGYAAEINTVEQYYKANMDMLCAKNRRELFPTERPVRTREHEEVSTYYGEYAKSVNSLVSDNCIIEGSIKNCIVSSGARIEAGAVLENCIVMRGCTIGENVKLSYVIADKRSRFSKGLELAGCEKLPVVVPKGSSI